MPDLSPGIGCDLLRIIKHEQNLRYHQPPKSTILALSLNPGKFDNSADILVLVKNDDLHYTKKIGLTSRYCGPVGNSGIADRLPIQQDIAHLKNLRYVISVLSIVPPEKRAKAFIISFGRIYSLDRGYRVRDCG